MRYRTVSSLLLAAVVAVGMVPKATADPGNPNQTPTDNMIAVLQEPLVTANSNIEELLTKTSSWERYFSGVEIHVLEQAIDVYITKDAPSSFIRALNTATTAVTARILPTAFYSRSEMIKAATQLLLKTSAEGAAPMHDGSGIRLSVTSEKARSTSMQPANLEKLSGGLPVQVEESGSTVPSGGTRQNNTGGLFGKTWDAGGRISNWGCTTGFGVSDANGDYLLTAAHCTGGTTQTAVAGNGTQVIGTSANRNTTIDGMRIKVNGTSAEMFDGAWNQTPRFVTNITGKATNPKGAYVCASGSFTGANCNPLISDSTYLYTLTSNPLEPILGVRAKLSPYSGTPRTHGRGDSGGPVFYWTSNGNSRLAAGIVSAGQGLVACGDTDAFACHDTIIYVDITKALAGANLHITT